MRRSTRHVCESRQHRSPGATTSQAFVFQAPDAGDAVRGAGVGQRLRRPVESGQNIPRRCAAGAGAPRRGQRGNATQRHQRATTPVLNARPVRRCSPARPSGTDTYSMSTRPLTSQPFSAESNSTGRRRCGGQVETLRDSCGGCRAGQAASGSRRFSRRKTIMTMRLRTSDGPDPAPDPRENNRHISCGSEHTGIQRLMLLAGRRGASWPYNRDHWPRGQDGAARGRGRGAAMTQRDIDGLVLCGEHYAAPYDLAGGLRGQVAAGGGRPRSCGAGAARGIRRGRAARVPVRLVLADQGRDERDGGWGSRLKPCRPALGRLAHTPRGAGRPAVDAGTARPGRPGGRGGTASGGCAPTSPPRAAPGMCQTRRSTGRPSRAARTPGRSGRSRWSSRPRRRARTARIITELLAAARHAHVVYLTAPAARRAGHPDRADAACRPGTRARWSSGTCRRPRSCRSRRHERLVVAEAAGSALWLLRTTVDGHPMAAPWSPRRARRGR